MTKISVTNPFLCRIINLIIENWVVAYSNSRDLITLAAMVHEALYHAGEIATIELSSGCFCKVRSTRSSDISWTVFLIKQLFRSRLMEMR